MSEKLDNFREVLLDRALEQLEYKSVLKLISKHCLTELGGQTILASYPTSNLDLLREEIDRVEEWVVMVTEDERPPLENMSDLRNLFSKATVTGAALSEGELLKAAATIRIFRLVKKFFEPREERYPQLADLALLMTADRLLEKHITDAIDEAGEIKDDATKELYDIRREIREKSTRLRNRLQRILRKVSDEDLLQEEFVTMREGRFVLPVRSEHKRHIPGIIHGLSQTGQTVFLEPSEIIETNNELSLLHNRERREMMRILTNLTAELGSQAREFIQSLEILSQLDAINAKANYALKYGGVKPDILDEDELYLKDVKHPLLLASKQAKDVVPLSVDFDSGKRGRLVSGPNAGGKTVALKSIGVNVALALSGFFPLGVCRTNYLAIFASIGDHQSIEQDLSTFSSQMMQIKGILENCAADSLVLIDEIGSGTDPQEGAALACGIMDTLIELKSFFVATTHQSSLKSYALTKEEIANASLEFDETAFKPTYNFLPDVPGNSYAFALAENLGLSRLVIERSRKYLGKKQSQLEESIAELQKYKAEAHKLEIKARQELAEAEQIKKKYEQKFADIKEKRQKYTEEAKQEALKIVGKANALIENTIKEIQEDKKSFAEIKKDYSDKKADIEKEISVGKPKKEKIEDEFDFKPGDSVALKESPDSVGTIIQSMPDKNAAVVEFNGLKFRMPLKQLCKAKKKKERRASRGGTSGDIDFSAASEIDLRGMRVEEALEAVGEFISKALISSLSFGRIIHGKGTGALREAVRDYLSRHQSVKSFRPGERGEGDDGVTIAEF